MFGSARINVAGSAGRLADRYKVLGTSNLISSFFGVEYFPMFILDRLVSRSARSLAVMIGFAQSGSGRGWGEARGRPSIALRAHLLPSPRRTPFQ